MAKSTTLLKCCNNIFQATMADASLTTTDLQVTGISIVVPAYNEEALLETFLKKLLATSLKWGQAVEMIF